MLEKLEGRGKLESQDVRISLRNPWTDKHRQAFLFLMDLGAFFFCAEKLCLVGGLFIVKELCLLFEGQLLLS